jgi:hypothetical protein
MLIDHSSRIRCVRLLFIIGILLATGFSIIGLLVKEWAFAVCGLILGLIISGMGIGFNYIFKKSDSHIFLLKYFKPVIYIFFTIQVLIVLINLNFG